MSADLARKIRLGLEEFATVREQMSPLIAISSDSKVGDIETAAASAMLHSFYTEIEKILKLIAREWDERMPSSAAWPCRDPKRVSSVSALVPRSVHCVKALGQAFSSHRQS